MDAPSSEERDLGKNQDRTDGAGLNGRCCADYDSGRRTRGAGVRMFSTSPQVWRITYISVYLLVLDLALEQSSLVYRYMIEKFDPSNLSHSAFLIESEILRARIRSAS